MARKYKKGNCILTVADYEKASQTMTFFMVGNKTTHKGWIESWQYQYLKKVIYLGNLYEALPVEKEDKDA